MKTVFSLGALALCLAAVSAGCVSNAADQAPPATAPAVAPSGAELKVGDNAPGFALHDQDDKVHALADYKGKVVVLAFYPADMTKGCTIEAHQLSRIAGDLEKRGVKLFGVSVQDVNSKKQFCEKEGIKYTLLADAEKAVSRAYGVLQPSGVASRTTFVIAPNGVIGAIQRKVTPLTCDKDTLQMVEEVLKKNGAA
jgi:peroxiredoxin Q/BCP